MQITFAEISQWLGQLWWPFFRIGAAFLAMPFFGDALIPVWFVHCSFYLSWSLPRH